MSSRTWIASALALGLAAAGWWWMARDRSTSKAAGTAPALGSNEGEPGRSPLLPPRLAGRDVPTTGGAEGAIAIAPDRVLAEVNGVAIRLGDLMVVEPGVRDPQLVDPAALRYLLDRAIDRELVGQAARAAGVKLDATQASQLAEVRDQLNNKGPGVVADLTRTPAYVEFDVRDTEGLMLQTNLVAQSGAPSPHVARADVDAYYQAHRADFPALPDDATERAKAWRKIERGIREQLSETQGERYREAVAAYLRDLRARAAIVESDVAAGRR